MIILASFHLRGFKVDDDKGTKWLVVVLLPETDADVGAGTSADPNRGALILGRGW